MEHVVTHGFRPGHGTEPVGAGLAGAKAAEALRREGFDDRSRAIVGDRLADPGVPRERLVPDTQRSDA